MTLKRIKTMKYIQFAFSVLLLGLLVSCDSWTTMEVDKPTDLLNSARTDTYYTNLRAYKHRSHPIVYGKWAGWTGTGATTQGQLIGLPDSLDIIGVMGTTASYSAVQKDDMKMVQERKGTKVILAVSVTNIGDMLGGGRIVNTPEEYAESLLAIVAENGFDGLDIELRPQINGTGSIAGHAANTQSFVQTLAKGLGPKSGTQGLLLLSGELSAVEVSELSCFNYWVSYAFGIQSDAELDKALRSLSESLIPTYLYEETAKKVIFMEDFLTNPNGGVPFTDRFNNTMFSLEGIARWLPLNNGRYINKAGVGIYRMDQEYTMDGFNSTFPYLHQAIQIVNPSIK